MISTIEKGSTKRYTKQPNTSNTIKQFYRPFHKRLLNKHFQSIRDFRSRFFSDTELNQILCDSPINLHSEKSFTQPQFCFSKVCSMYGSMLERGSEFALELFKPANRASDVFDKDLPWPRTQLQEEGSSGDEGLPTLQTGTQSKKQNVKCPLLEGTSAVLLLDNYSHSQTVNQAFCGEEINSNGLQHHTVDLRRSCS